MHFHQQAALTYAAVADITTRPWHYEILLYFSMRFARTLLVPSNLMVRCWSRAWLAG